MLTIHYTLCLRCLILNCYSGQIRTFNSAAGSIWKARSPRVFSGNATAHDSFRMYRHIGTAEEGRASNLLVADGTRNCGRGLDTWKQMQLASGRCHGSVIASRSTHGRGQWASFTRTFLNTSLSQNVPPYFFLSLSLSPIFSPPFFSWGRLTLVTWRTAGSKKLQKSSSIVQG